MATLKQSYKGPAKLIAQYWSTYGGWQDFVLSPYLHASLLMLLITYATWSDKGWWEQVLSVVPSLLGFSLGALAIFLGFGSEQFRNVISGKRPGQADKASPYMSVTAAFTHFIVVQVAAVMVAVISVALFKLPAPASHEVLYSFNCVGKIVLWGFGYWLFLYALCLAAASVFAVFRIASWYDEHRTRERQREASRLAAEPSTEEQSGGQAS